MTSPNVPIPIQPPPSRWRSLTRWLPIGLFAVAALALIRYETLLVLERDVALTPEASVRWNVANVFPQNFVHVLVFGFLAAVYSARTLDAARSSRPAPARGLVLGLTTALFASALTGWPISLERFLPRLGIDGIGLFGTLPLVIGAAFVMALLVEGLNRLAVRGRRLPTSPIALGIAAIIFGLAFFRCFALPTPQMPVRTTVRELLFKVEMLEFLALPPAVQAKIDEAEVEPGIWFKENRRSVITPAIYAEFDVGDKPALLLPPGTSVAFNVTPSDGPVRLQAAAGASRKSYEGRPESPVHFARFEVLVNGTHRFDETLRLQGDVPTPERVWRHLEENGERGLALKPSDRVEMRVTAAADASGTPLANTEGLSFDELMELQTGFGGLVLERVDERPRTHSSPDFPNVVFIVMDTLRADRTSTYGYERPTTPALDRLAARGLVYENAYSTSSWTWPSTASLLTGLHPTEHGVLSNEACTLISPLVTVAEAMQREGWTTAGFACNPLIAANRGYDQGFERFEDVEEMTAARDVMPDVIDWLRDTSGTRFMLYLQLIDPHTPHDPDPDLEAQFVQATRPDFAAENPAFADYDEFDVATAKLGAEDAPLGPDGKPAVDEILSAETQAWLSQIYDASVATGDRALAQLVDEIERLGLTDRTLFVFTADHGEEILEHGYLAHGHSLHEELVRVPLVLAGPGVARSERIATPVSNRHIAPTLAMVAGTQLKHVLPVAFDLRLPTTVVPDDVLMQTSKGVWNGEKPTVLFGSRREDWKMIWAPEGKAFDALEPLTGGEARMFDLGTDPTEQLDLFPSWIGQVPGGMIRTIEAAVLRQRARRQGESSGTGEEGEDQLKNLGYTSAADADAVTLDADALIERRTESEDE